MTDLEVSLDDIGPLLDLASEAPAGGVLQRIARASRQSSGSGSGAIALTDYFRILGELSLALHDETIHLSSRHLMPGTTSYIVSNISACATLADAMKLIARSYNVLHGGSYNRVEKRDGYLLYIIDDSSFPYREANDDYIHFSLECVMILLHGMLSLVTSDALLPFLRKVHTKGHRGTPGSNHMAFWDAPVRYQSKNYTLIYDLPAARLPITLNPGAIPSHLEIYQKIISMIESRSSSSPGKISLMARVQGAIEQGIHDQHQVATQLGVSVATLKRRLREENTGFRHISHEVLNGTAKRLLSQHLHVSEVAEELGYSDFRSFTRAFKNWNGETPREYIGASESRKVL